MYHQKASTVFRKYALPQMAGLLLNSIYLIVDGIFIGNRLGREAMAAAAVSVPVIEILIALALAVSSGAGVMISAHLGKADSASAKRVSNQAMLLLGIISLLIAGLGSAFVGPLATLLGATPDIHAQAVDYLRYIVTFSPFLLFSFLLSGLVRNDGRPTLSMVALAVGSVSNIVLDYVFMYPLNMGIAGAALATALGPVLSVLILLPHFLRKKGALSFAKPQFSLPAFGNILTLGFPAFIMEFSIGIVTFLYNSAIVRQGYGELGLAAYLMIGYLMLIILTLFLGLAQGLQPVFSYYAGAEDSHRSKALLAYAAKVVCAVGVLCYALVALLSPAFYAMFAPTDAALVAFAS